MVEQRALVIASEETLRQELGRLLASVGFAAASVADDAGAYAELVRGVPALVVADVAAGNALDREALLVGLLSLPERPPMVVVAPESARRLAAALVRRGAVSALRLPLEPDEARAIFSRACTGGVLRRERVALLADLEAMRTLFHDALLNVMEGVLIIDASGTIVFANAEAARILLQDREALMGTRLDPIMGSALYGLLKAARSSPERSAAGESETYSGDEHFKLLARASIVHDHDGRPVGGLLVLRTLDAAQPGVAGLVAARAAAAPSQPGRATPAPAPRPPTAVMPVFKLPPVAAPVPVPAPAPAQPVAAASPLPAQPVPELDAAKKTTSFMIQSILGNLKERTEKDATRRFMRPKEGEEPKDPAKPAGGQ